MYAWRIEEDLPTGDCFLTIDNETSIRIDRTEVIDSMAFIEMKYCNFEDAIQNYVERIPKPHHFNCKRCGAVGQVDICEYCGSADDKEESKWTNSSERK